MEVVRRSGLIVLVTLMVWYNCSKTISLPVEETLDYAVQQYLRTANALDPEAGLPRTTDADGKWVVTSPADWTSGFYPGVLWYLYEYSANEELKLQAERWTAMLEQQKNDTSHHDVGFQIFCLYGNGYRLTGNRAYKDVIIQAANSLATRYNPVVGAIKSWSWNPDPPQWTYPVIVDNMMNLELLFWASKNGGDHSLGELAVQHANTTLEHHVRDDGSTYHLVDFNPKSFEFESARTWQGYSMSSTWSRGQAWGLYGFTMAYRETSDEKFLKTAMRMADFIVENLPRDGVPYWDFRALDIPDAKRDASAAAITASALLELHEYVDAEPLRAQYLETAIQILHTLCSERYLTRGLNSDALLLHCVGSHPENREMDVPLIYADYYFVEALIRYRNLSENN